MWTDDERCKSVLQVNIKIYLFFPEKCYIFFAGQVPLRQRRCGVSIIPQVSVNILIKYDFIIFLSTPGMPGSGGHYGVMGRSQDHRSSMFGSSLNLNGEYFTTLYDCSDMIYTGGICCARVYFKK